MTAEPYYQADRVTLYLGDCIEVMRELPEASVDAVVCDPPYGLGFMGKEWDNFKHQGNGGPQRFVGDHKATRERSASMHAGEYDLSPTANRKFQQWCEAWAREAYRVLKPGGHLAAFGGTRTYHRLASGIEDAGFEIRDMTAWMYGSGFPKSLDVSKAIDRAAVIACPDCHATGKRKNPNPTQAEFADYWTDDPCPRCGGTGTLRGAEREVIGDNPNHRPVSGVEYEGVYSGGNTGAAIITAPATAEAAQWQGWGTALKPAHEPICLARKPLIGTVAQNVLTHGTGALNIDGCRIAGDEDGSRNRPPSRLGSSTTYAQDEWTRNAVVERQDTTGKGRWPANVILDEEWTPVLRLRDNLSSDAWSLLEEWCRERSREVPPVSSRDRRLSQPEEADEVLLASLLRDVAEREQPGRGASDDGAQALRGIAREDARNPETQRATGSGESIVEGRGVPEQGLQDDLVIVSPAGSAGDSGTDDGTRARIPAGASPRDGAAPRPPAPAERSGAPLQRHQDGQPDRESGAERQRDAQAGASSDQPRVTSAQGRERTTPRSAIEVLMRDVPLDWIARYFEPTGHVARVGAAALLDATVGVLHAGGTTRDGKGSIFGNADGEPENAQRAAFNDPGGPSRFFYTAKASRSEREAGLEALPLKTPGELTDRKDGAAGTKHARAGAGGSSGGRRNDHPTVKPIDLMRWLCRLVTPPGGVILDPFLGSGTTALAALDEQFRIIGIDMDPHYIEVAKYRLTHRHLLDETMREPVEELPQGRLF